MTTQALYAAIEQAPPVLPGFGQRITARELLRAQFGRYAADYILLGTQSQQVAGIGNSVPPEMAEALVRANMPMGRRKA